ncbi:hypothetical protein [Tateyamaria omphalii]|uniref:Uncharacterized protein n=1 Tax=Tateyamaria omphalii TaxID=299262 RepID=A0A1P8MV65_9RHOB|nr:hypothetical protein [Tateyamaria omphalii]APX11990.1 hypothetical protein BWR18_10100 [Tateyamaria omphalii]
MTTLTVTSGQQTYTIAPIPAGPVAHRARAVLRARLVDELTGLGVRGGVSIDTALTGLSARMAGDGIVGFVANPARRFTDLVANAATIDFDVSARRFLPRALSVNLGPFNIGLGDPVDFPDHFEPLDLGDIPLHRSPVRIAGHVMSEVGETRTPLVGVDVQVTGIWSTEPGPDVEAETVVETPEILSLSPVCIETGRLRRQQYARRGSRWLGRPSGCWPLWRRVQLNCGLVIRSGWLLAICLALPMRM